MNKEKLTNFHRENILNEADKLFLELGFEKTTVELIAKKASYSKPTLYAYFKSKDEIFAFVLQKYMQKFKCEIEEILAGEDIVNAYIGVCMKVYELKENAATYFDGIMGNIDFRGNIDSELGKQIELLALNINQKMYELMKRAEDEGLVTKQFDERFAYDFIWSCVFGIVSSQRLAFSKMKNKEEKEQKLKKCFINILNSLK